MARSVPTSSRMSYSKSVTYISFERPHGDWIEWEIHTRQAISLYIGKTGETHMNVVRHNSHWRKLHSKEELKKFIFDNTGKITQITSLEAKIKLADNISKHSMSFLLWTDNDLGLYI